MRSTMRSSATPAARRRTGPTATAIRRVAVHACYGYPATSNHRIDSARQVRLRHRQRRLAQLRPLLPGPLRGLARRDAGMLGRRVQLHGAAVLDDLRGLRLHADQGARRRADLRDCAGAAVVHRGLHAARQRVVRRAERSRLDHRSDPLHIVDPERHGQSLRDDHAALQGCCVECVDLGFLHRDADDLLFRSAQGRHHDAGLDLGSVRLVERRGHGFGFRRLDADHSRRAVLRAQRRHLPEREREPAHEDALRQDAHPERLGIGAGADRGAGVAGILERQRVDAQSARHQLARGCSAPRRPRTAATLRRRRAMAGRRLPGLSAPAPPRGAWAASTRRS